MLTRLQSFDDLQASEFAATQVVPTAGNQYGCQGGRGVYVRAERGSLPPRASDMLAPLKQLASLTGNLGGEPAPKRESSQWQPIAKRL